jgi:hypothetical protein
LISFTVTLFGLLAAKSQLIVGFPLSDTVMDTIVDVEYNEQDQSGFDVGHMTSSLILRGNRKITTWLEFSEKSKMVDEIHRSK